MMRTSVALLGAAVAWTVHFNTSYALVALGCAAVVSGPGAWLVVVTLVCAAAAVVSGTVAVRDWRAARRGRHEQQRVLMAVGALAAAVFTVAIVFEGVVPAFLPYCPAGG
jgi:cation transport ATPase